MVVYLPSLIDHEHEPLVYRFRCFMGRSNKLTTASFTVTFGLLFDSTAPSKPGFSGNSASTAAVASLGLTADALVGPFLSLFLIVHSRIDSGRKPVEYRIRLSLLKWCSRMSPPGARRTNEDISDGK